MTVHNGIDIFILNKGPERHIPEKLKNAFQ